MSSNRCSQRSRVTSDGGSFQCPENFWVDTHDEHFLVVGAVEDPDSAPLLGSALTERQR